MKQLAFISHMIGRVTPPVCLGLSDLSTEISMSVEITQAQTRMAEYPSGQDSKPIFF